MHTAARGGEVLTCCWLEGGGGCPLPMVSVEEACCCREVDVGALWIWLCVGVVLSEFSLL